MNNSNNGRTVAVFGPAYLDRVAHVDAPLVDRAIAKPLDASVEGVWESIESEKLTLVDPLGAVIKLTLAADWPGPRGLARLKTALTPGVGRWRSEVQSTTWRDDLGGMGAGFAKAFKGTLTCGLGPEDDPVGIAVLELLGRYNVAARPIRVNRHAADWTLLVTSGAHGDKLPVGFRGCHANLKMEDVNIPKYCDLAVVAGVSNALAERWFRRVEASTRFFAPGLRNMVDRSVSVGRFGDAIDILSCNRREWETLKDRAEVLEKVAIVAVTDGPRGGVVWFRDRGGTRREVGVAAFPRSRPPRDTNRAGKAFASTLVSTLLDSGWTRGGVDRAVMEHAGTERPSPRRSCSTASRSVSPITTRSIRA